MIVRSVHFSFDLPDVAAIGTFYYPGFNKRYLFKDVEHA
jgi:hypothetical protein